MRRAVELAVLLGVLLSGVARADSGWREIQAPHVVLRTDLGSAAAKEAALAVERFRAEIITAAWPRATLPAGDRIEMTVFSNGLDFEHHFGRNLAGARPVPGDGPPGRGAWKVILPGLNTPDVDDALNQYVKHGNYSEFLAPFTPPAPSMKETALTEADVHAERARVAMAAARSTSDRASHEEEARRELAVALKLEPANANALLLQARGAPAAERATLARRITEAHPDDGRAWVALGQALVSTPAAAAEREAAFRKAIALRPDDPTPLNDLAWLYAGQGKAAEAAPLIGKAIQLAPYDPSMLDTLAAVQAQLGRCSEAVASQARAIDALPDGVPAAARHALEARLEQYRTRCAPVGTTPGPGG